MAAAVGRLRPGLRADFAIFDLEPGSSAEGAMIRQGSGSCRATIVGGEVRWTMADGIVERTRLG